MGKFHGKVCFGFLKWCILEGEEGISFPGVDNKFHYFSFSVAVEPPQGDNLVPL